MITVVIVGRPNVGKSSLFNDLATSRQYKKAITHNSPGITRDYKTSSAELADLQFEIIDTAGLYFAKNLTPLEENINRQAEYAITKADVVLFVVDGKEGLTEYDKNISEYLRKKGIKASLLINKCDVKKSQLNTEEFYELGYKDTYKISAEHKIGFSSIYETIEPHCRARRARSDQDSSDTTIDPEQNSKEIPSSRRSTRKKDAIDSEDFKESSSKFLREFDEKKNIKISVIGRPNAGKSTFINSMLNESRLITGPEPGITRDSISVSFTYKNKYNIEFTDTAGVRKRKNIHKNSIEKISVGQTLNAVENSDIIVLIIDINAPLEIQDLKIATFATNSNKPIILAVNKKDTLKDAVQRKAIKDDIEYTVANKVSGAKNMPIVYISALTKSNITKVIDKCIEQYKLWHTQIPTSQLNKWLSHTIASHQPPLSSEGKTIRLKYMTQIQSNPIIFKLFLNKVKEIPSHYMKYMINKLKEDFDLQGLPIRLVKSKSPNPYEK